jgi:hypothetical protein
MNPPALPYPLAMVICDAVWRDPSTGKHTLLGCFNGIAAASFPTVHPQLAVFVAITEGYGKVPLALRLVDGVEVSRSLSEATVELDFADPMAIAEIAVQFQKLQFDRPGTYRLQLVTGGHLLMERRIVVHESRPQGRPTSLPPGP